jgi:hypothetical protein
MFILQQIEETEHYILELQAIYEKGSRNTKKKSIHDFLQNIMLIY